MSIKKDRGVPDSHSRIETGVRPLRPGDTALHFAREPRTRGRAIVDIFRLENGEVVEHRDAVSGVPEEAANPDGMS